jgi:hypothetical protein
VTFLKNISAKFFQADKLDKANKIFQRINFFFKSKDAHTNFCEENELSTEYRDAQDQMSALQVTNWTNLALVFFKQGENIKCIEMCDQALQ